MQDVGLKSPSIDREKLGSVVVDENSHSLLIDHAVIEFGALDL